MSQELQDYIAQARKVGKSDEEIVKSLIQKGYKIDAIISVIHPSSPKSDKKVSKRYIITSIIIIVLLIAFSPIIIALLKITYMSILLLFDVVTGGAFRYR